MENILIVLFLAGLVYVAVKWLLNARDMRSAEGCNNLGFMYYLGAGVQQDHSKAAKLYKKACDMGNAEACTSLGAMYVFGQGVQQDYSKAAEFYKKACDMGNAEGCENYTKLKQKY